MNNLSEYKIAFKGLKEGDHLFEFAINDWFFEYYKNNIVEQGELKAEVLLKKQSTMLVLELSVDGTVTLQCDRCLENYLQAVKNKSRLYVKFGPEAEDLGDDIIAIPFEEYQIDVAYYLYELIILGLPIKHVHPSKGKSSTGCNPEMLEQIDKYSARQEKQDLDQDAPIDERWLKLKNLFDNK